MEGKGRGAKKNQELRKKGENGMEGERKERREKERYKQGREREEELGQRRIERREGG